MVIENAIYDASHTRGISRRQGKIECWPISFCHASSSMIGWIEYLSQRSISQISVLGDPFRDS